MSKPHSKSGEIDKTKLFTTDEKSYGGKYSDHLLEQYKLLVEMSDNVSARRLDTNKFFLTINAVLVTVLGLMSEQASILFVEVFWRGIVALSGLLFCILWWAMIRSFKSLNRAKFEVINSLEQNLPSAGYYAEWDFLERLDKKEKHRELTTIETWIPFVFGCIYIFMMVILFIGAYYSIVVPLV